MSVDILQKLQNLQVEYADFKDVFYEADELKHETNRFAFHENIVWLRMKLNTRGLATEVDKRLKEMGYPFGRTPINGYKSGEMMLDDQQRAILDEIFNAIDRDPKYVRGSEMKTDDIDLSSSMRKVRYAMYAETAFYNRCVAYQISHGGHPDIEQFNVNGNASLVPSNFSDLEVAGAWFRAIHHIITNELRPYAPSAELAKEKDPNRLRRAHTKGEYVVAKSVFDSLTHQVARCPKLARLVPIALFVNFLDDSDKEINIDVFAAHEKYDEFKTRAIEGKISKSISEGWLSKSIEVARKMIANGWLSDFEESEEDLDEIV